MATKDEFGALPSGQYLQIYADTKLSCYQCGVEDNHLAIANEVFFDEGDLIGIDAVVRFVLCGHRVPGGTASPISVALMLDKMESLMSDE